MRKLVHDARDSLNSIALNSDVLVRVLDERGGAVDGRARRAAASIRDAAYRLADQMEALFEGSRGFDPAAVLREFARESREDGAGPEVELVDVPDEGPSVEVGEEVLLRFLAAGRRLAAERGTTVRFGMTQEEEAAVVRRLDGTGGEETAAIWLPVQRGI